MSDDLEAQRQNLTRALQAAWKAEDEQVKKFGLSPLPDAISHSPAGWSVPVVSGVPTGSAYELVRTLNRLQEFVELSTSLSISIFLDPFAQHKSA